MKSALAILFSLTIIACSKAPKTLSTNEFVNKDYDIKICYLGCFNFMDTTIGNKWRYMYSKDSLYLFIEEGFDNDSMNISINNKFLYKKLISTDGALGFSEKCAFGPIKDIREISIDLNNGPKAVIEIDTTMQLLNVNHINKTLIISIIKGIPVYD